MHLSPPHHVPPTQPLPSPLCFFGKQQIPAIFWGRSKNTVRSLSSQGNDGLCGAPLRLSCDQTSQANRGLSGGIIALIILSCFAALLLNLVFILAAAHSRRHQPASRTIQPSSNKSTDHKYAAEEAENLELGMAQCQIGATAGDGKKCGKENDVQHGRLIFVREGREKFELQDLLQASAEVLGSGNFGASYKAALSVGPTVVVKRFKEMNGVGREDFNEHMRRLGRLSHPNILPLLAYYYKKEEKLLVVDFVSNGSLAQMLHGKHGSSLPPLDWPTRLKIAKGVARGLAYLYNELPILSLPHGHLKSSNVLLNETFQPLLTDYALAPVINPTAASQLLVAYKSPEANDQFGRPSKKSDVWSLGILILEILTGKFPANFLHKGKLGGTDLAAWVSSAISEEKWSSEVFDGDIMKRGAAEQVGNEEMHELLKIGLDCCAEEVDKRPDMREAVERIEQLNEREEVRE